MARTTKTEAALEAAEREHIDDPERAEVLARARRFKSSWLELATNERIIVFRHVMSGMLDRFRSTTSQSMVFSFSGHCIT